MLAEMERRVAPTSPYYMAKFILGRHFWENGETKGYGPHHRTLSAEAWDLYKSRKSRPWGTYYPVIWPRGTRKSTVINTGLSVCMILDNPNIRIMLDTDKLENAKKFMAPIRMAFEDEYFIYLFGDMRGDKWKADGFVVKRTAALKEETVFCSGVDAEKTGLHCDVILSDDIQTEGNSESQTGQESVMRDFRLYDSILDPGGICFMPMTTWNFGDLSEELLKIAENDVKEKRPKRIYVNKKSCYKKTPEGKFDYDSLEFPEILSKEVLEFKRSTQHGFLFSCNYLCEPMSDDTAWFHKEWFHYEERSLEQLQFDLGGLNVVIVADPAGEGNFVGADWNVVMAVGISPQNDLYVLEYLRAHIDREEFFLALVDFWKRYDASKVAVEKVFQQHELERWCRLKALEMDLHINWHDLKITSKVKEHRIRQLQPYFKNGKVLFRHDMYELEQEFIRYPKSKHDDLSDCLANALDFISAPPEHQPEEWWKKENWADDFEPTKERTELPTAGSVAAWAAQDRHINRADAPNRIIPFGRRR